MNPFDLAVIALLVVAVVLGYRSGALPQLGGLLGAVGGGALAVAAVGAFDDPIAAIDPATRPFVVLIGLLLAVVLGESMGSAVGRSLGAGLRRSVFSDLDRLAGALLGAAQAVLIAWLAGGLLAVGPMPRLAEWAQTSVIARSIAERLPPPTEIAVELGRVLDASGLPDVFIGFEPLPAPPVDRPDDPQARAIGALAEASTVRVLAATCGLQSSGTGFAVRPGYVVTNAHVVAGASSVQVRDAAGRLHDARAVLFDPAFDIALLHAPRLAAPVLALSSRDPERGAIGAVLGFPGGGALTIVPAAVTDGYPAVGRDIYDRERVERRILEIRAEIDRGDSGGPLVLPDGSVGGVVFAEARTDDEVGYALTPTEVARRIRPALERTAAADTGPCLRR